MDIFKYYSLTNYQHKLEKSNVILDDYKSSDKRENDKIKYVIFDIHSHIEEKGIIVNNIKYLDNLEFTYDIVLNKVIIQKLPTFKYDYDDIFVFTSDILEIIKKSLNKYTKIDDVEIVIDPLLIFAYSKDVECLIRQNKNIKLIDKIVERTDIARDSLNRKIIKEKRKLDESDKKREKVLEKRKETFGIKKEDFKSIEEYKQELNKKIVEYAKKQYERYDRHLNICKSKYFEYIKTGFERDIDFYFDNYIEYICDEDELEQIEDSDNPEELKKELLNKYIEKIMDLEINKISRVKEMQESDWKQEALESMDARLSRRGYEYTYELLQNVSFELNVDDIYIDFSKHPIYTTEDKEFIFKMINLVFYIYDLKEKIKYYQKIISNPDTACLEFEKNNILWGNILELPYFFKVACENFQNSYDKFNMLMIKPGTTNIDLDNIVFLSKYEKEAFRGPSRYGSAPCYETKKFKYNYHKKIVGDIVSNKLYNAERLIVTIPKSLEYEEVKKLVDFGIKYGFNINFICESLDVYLNVRRIIILKEIAMRKQDNTFIGNNGNIFVNIDPYYYQTYFATLPTNKVFWHMYNYSSNYKYNRKDINSLTSLIHECMYVNYLKNDGNINYEELEEHLLGSYEELKFEEFEINIYDAMHTFDMLWYNSLENEYFDFDTKVYWDEKKCESDLRVEKVLKRIEELKNI